MVPPFHPLKNTYKMEVMTTVGINLWIFNMITCSTPKKKEKTEGKVTDICEKNLTIGDKNKAKTITDESGKMPKFITWKSVVHYFMTVSH